MIAIIHGVIGVISLAFCIWVALRPTPGRIKAGLGLVLLASLSGFFIKLYGHTTWKRLAIETALTVVVFSALLGYAHKKLG